MNARVIGLFFQMLDGIFFSYIYLTFILVVFLFYCFLGLGVIFPCYCRNSRIQDIRH